MSAKIVLIVPALTLGGAERSLVKLVNAIRPRVGPVTVLILTRGDQELLDELPSNVEVVCLHARSSADPRLWVRIIRFLLRCRPDVVVGWSTYANLLTVLCGRIAGCLRGCRPRLVVSERNYVPESLRPDRVGWIRRAVLRWLMPRLYGRATAITANSTRNLEFLCRFVQGRPIAALLPNCIDMTQVERLAGNPIAIEAQGASRRLLGVGRMVEQKGFDVLLRAMAIVVAKDSGWILALVGEGPELDRLKRLAQDLGIARSVIWVGRVANPFPYYRWAEVVALPSRHEGFPNVMLEAMASGRPVVAADCLTGPRELSRDGRNACLVPVDQPEALAAEILRLGADPARRESLGQSARAHVEATYGIASVADRYLAVLLGDR